MEFEELINNHRGKMNEMRDEIVELATNYMTSENEEQYINYLNSNDDIYLGCWDKIVAAVGSDESLNKYIMGNDNYDILMMIYYSFEYSIERYRHVVGVYIDIAHEGDAVQFFIESVQQFPTSPVHDGKLRPLLKVIVDEYNLNVKEIMNGLSDRQNFVRNTLLRLYCEDV